MQMDVLLGTPVIRAALNRVSEDSDPDPDVDPIAGD
jgi:hypothetical protein